mgnify:CR=1 FL=1
MGAIRTGFVRNLLLAGVSAFAIAGAPSDVWSQTLAEALAEAYGTNPTLQAARAELRATDEGVAQALSNWRPSIVATGTAQRTSTQSLLSGGGVGFGSIAGVTNDDTRNVYSTGVRVEQNLFRGGQTIAETREAKARVAAGRARLTDTEQNVLLDAVTAYMDVLRDGATVELNANNVVVLQRQLEASQDRFDVGEITRTDVAQSEARLSRARSALIQAEANRTNSRATYERVMGAAPGTLDPAPPLPALPASEEEALQLALANNPAIMASRFNEEATRHSIDGAKGTLLPSVTLEGEFGYADNPSSAVDNAESGSVTARLTVPLYQSGAEYSRIRQAKQLNSQSRLQIAEAVRQTQEGVASAWEIYRAANAQIESDREQVRANEIALDGVRQESQVGSRTTLDVLDAEQELLDSRVALVTSERDAYVAAYRLLAAVGYLTAGRLGLGVDLYDPAGNYDRVNDKWVGFGVADEPSDVAADSRTDAADSLASN